MMQEKEYDYKVQNTEAIQLYAHQQMKDPNEEYSRQYKKRKPNEQMPYKDLSDRNPLLTIYRAVSYDEPDKQIIINKIIQWLQNQQKTILQRSEKDKLSEKSFLKHILTQLCEKQYIEPNPNNNSNPKEFIAMNQTFVHYINEAVEKQSEGYVNNILMMVQPNIKKYQNNNLNYFAQAVAYQMKQSKRSQIPTESSYRSNKVLFINLTGKESLQNLESWQQYLEKSDEFVYFSFIKVQGEEYNDLDNQFNDYSNYFKQMEQANFNYYLLPYVCPQSQDYNNTNILHGQLVKAFFSNFMHNRIERFSHKGYIALSLSLSDDIEYDPFTIKFLINNLTKLSNDKLMIHINIEIPEEDITYEKRLTQLMNLCYSSFSEQNISIQKLIPQDKIVLSQLIDRLKKIYRYLNLENQYKSIQYCDIAIENLQQQINRIKENPIQYPLANLYCIFYKRNSQQYLIIRPELENEDQITPFTQIIINYQDDIIILYQDGEKKFLYFLHFNNSYFNKRNLIEKIKFQNLTNFLESANIANQIVFYFNYQIYVFYGQQQNNFNLAGQRINIISMESTPLTFTNQDKQFQVNFHSKIAIQKLTNEQLIDKLKSRISPTVCIENYKDQILKIVLFGGENIETPQIMNLIEYMEIRDQQFTTGILDKSNLFKDISFKPFPGQTILSTNQQNDMLYLILPGNDALRKKSLNHPINTLFHKNAILMKKGCLDYSLSNIPINYYGDISYGLNFISNSQQNSQLIFLDDNLVIWRVIYTQTMKIESIQKLKLDFSQAWGSKCANTEFSHKKEKLFKEQYHDIEMILAYLIEIQKEISEGDVNELIDKKNKFDKSKEKSELNIQNQDELFKQKDHFKQKLDQGQLFDLSGNPFNQRDKMQEEKGNLNEQQQNPPEFFKSNLLDIYDGDNKQLYQIAYENYLYLDLQTKQLSVKQFTYLIGDALSLPQIDITNQQQVIKIQN
ncbi:unnamed protein product [Paramecium primaurelia]|uniref:Uncharacterized protein n=1 Tax=Paramecium primaurelia TaxID=5886 RepID=A0A8S1PUB5_PARPR|nr:unnamed protein product [Paramecium primaurelia]